MPAKISPAQRALQILYFLKGDLKNIQLGYLRAGAKLAKIRDEKLWRALKHESLESCAQERLRLGRTSLYRYLRIYDWVRKSHRGWLAKHPKGFIPELTEAYDLIWIEERLEDEHLAPELRKELEALRRKGLSGKLTQRELEEFRERGRKHQDSLTAINASLRAIRGRLAALPVSLPLLAELDVFLEHLKSASGAVARASRPGNARTMRPPAVSRKSPSAGTRGIRREGLPRRRR
jgi:hypothetical protein